MPRCWNKVRYEVMDHLGYSAPKARNIWPNTCRGSSRKAGEDLIEEFRIPLDEYPLGASNRPRDGPNRQNRSRPRQGLRVMKSHRVRRRDDEMPSATDTPYVVYANLPNRGQVPQLPMGACGRDADAGRCQWLPAHECHRYSAATGALMRSQINVQELVVRAAGRGEPRSHLPRRLHGPPYRRRA